MMKHLCLCYLFMEYLRLWNHDLLNFGSIGPSNTMFHAFNGEAMYLGSESNMDIIDIDLRRL